MNTPQSPVVPGVRRVIAALAVLATVPVAWAAPASAQEPADEFVAGQLLVRFDKGTGSAESSEIAESQGAQVIDRFSIVPRLALVDLPAGLSVGAAESRFEGIGDVTFAQPNRVYRVDAEPDDPFFAGGSLWGLNNFGQDVPNLFPPPATVPGGAIDADIDAPEAWDLQTGDPSVTVGVIDSGITPTHEDLAGNLWNNVDEIPTNDVDDDGNGRKDDVYGWDFVEEGGGGPDAGDSTPDDANSHGSHVAGTIGAKGDNGVGATGVSWDVSLMGLKAGTADGLLYENAIIDAIGYADEMGAQIVNGSYTGGGSDAPTDASRIAYQNASDVLFVVAAGNEGTDNDATPRFPCSYTLPNVLCVGSTNPSDGLSSFSNYGNDDVDLAAPGSNILSTEPAFQAPLFFDNFEDGDLADWVIGGTPADSWSNSTEAPRLGARALSDSPGGDYEDDEDSFIRTAAPISLAGEDSCRLNLALGFNLGSGDTLRAEYTTDADPDTGTWMPLYALNPYSGTGTFARRNLDFDFREVTGSPNVYFRFRLVTGSSGTADGVHIDEVKVECVDTAATGSYRVKQGTSMAAPQVAGAAALLVAEYPGYDVEQLRNALLGGVEPLGSLQCKTVSGGRLNAFGSLAYGAPLTAPEPSCPPVVDPPDPPGPPPPDPDPKKKKKCKKKVVKAGDGATTSAVKKKKRCKKSKKKRRPRRAQPGEMPR